MDSIGGGASYYCRGLKSEPGRSPHNPLTLITDIGMATHRKDVKKLLFSRRLLMITYDYGAPV